jgi:hypothetical protein
VLIFTLLGPGFWLEVLISCVCSIEAFILFRQDWVVTSCAFSHHWTGLWSSTQSFAYHAQDTGSRPLLHSED